MDEIIKQLKSALPEDMRENEEINKAIAHIAEADKRLKLEAEFLKRAAASGLKHAGDALKLEDIPARLQGDDMKQALDSLFEELRENRPWLFGNRKPTPGNEKTQPNETVLEKTRRQWNGGGLTRQVLKFRRNK